MSQDGFAFFKLIVLDLGDTFLHLAVAVGPLATGGEYLSGVILANIQSISRESRST